MCCVRRIGGKGSDKGQFDSPRQLTTDPIGRVFIADYGNDRICIHDPNLNHLHNITHESKFRPTDVKVSGNRLYVLCHYINTFMVVLILEGDKLHSLITRQPEKESIWYALSASVWIIAITLSLAISCLTQFVSSPEGKLYAWFRHSVGLFENGIWLVVVTNFPGNDGCVNSVLLM